MDNMDNNCVSAQVAELAARETSRLYQALSIVELAIASIFEEYDGKPAIKPALRAVSDVILASINALDAICVPGPLSPVGTAEEVSHD